jgi:ATP-dependent RNA helicase DeaD
VTIRVTPKQLTVDAIEQAYVEVPASGKTDRLVEVLGAEEPEQAIIFCRTKIGTASLDEALRRRGLRVKALHADLTQGQRDGVMLQFKDHQLPLLVATDVAARGLDIEHVTHVINYDVPDVTDTYIHRIGRTGRVGRTGRAIARRPRLHRDRREPEAEPVKLFLNRGRRSGIDADDVRWALAEGAVIPAEAIGDIRVLERFSFVELDAEHAERALERLDGTKLSGRQIRLEYARG